MDSKVGSWALLVGLFALPSLLYGQSSPTATPYGVQPGDVLNISVWKEPELQADVLVRPDGGISFPLAGEIDANGRTVEEIRAELESRLARFIPDLVVTVTVREIVGNRVYVIGQVQRPGPFVMNPTIDVLQALSLAGGTTAFAAVNEIKILRRNSDDRMIFEFDFSEVADGQNLEQNILLQSGDVVVVP